MCFSTYNLPTVRNAICSLLLVAIGSLFVPLPQFRYFEKDQAVAFPCQDRACGCRTAEDCWTNCCCFSDEEKVAWAAANGVQPPDWFRPITKSVKVAELDLEAKPCCCCKCGTKKSPAAKKPRPEENAGKPNPRSTTVILQFVQQKCRGDIDYLSSRIILTFDRPLIEAEDLSEPLSVETLSIYDPFVLPPPTPPPRRLLS